MKSIDWLLFGGTFDPPHIGHRACVESAMNALTVGRCYVVPALNPPIAGEGVKTPGGSFEQRLSMTNLCFEKSELSEQISVLDIERHLPSPSFTVNTINHLIEKYPRTQGGLLIGFDQLKSFHRWQEPRSILKSVSLMVVNRNQSSVRDGFNTLAANLDTKFSWHGDHGKWEESGADRSPLMGWWICC